MAGQTADGGLNHTALDPALPRSPWAVPGGVPLGLRALTHPWYPERGSRPPGDTGALVSELGLVSGWQLRRLLRCRAPDLPGRLVRAGVLTAHVVEGPVRLPRLYGTALMHAMPPWDGLAAVKQAAANQFLVQFLDLGPAHGAAFRADWGPGLTVVRGADRFTVAAFREGRDEEQRFEAFLDGYRPGSGKAVVVAATVGHMVRLSGLARVRTCPLRLTWDGALFHLPLARAFCRVGGDGPVPVLMSGLGADEGRGK